VRENYYWLAGGWQLMLVWCKRKTLFAGWRSSQQSGVNLGGS